MKKIIITGISSFIGFHLAMHFSKTFMVYGTLTQKLSDYKNMKAMRLNNLVNHINYIEEFDITNPDIIKNTISEVKPDFFIHHAGWTESYSSLNYDLKKSYLINVFPLSILFSSLKVNDCKGIILTGSSAEYSDGEQPDEETDSCFPSMPYGLSKLSQTLYAKQLAEHYSLSTRIARVYIPFGPFDSSNKLIPYAINQLNNNLPAELSPGTQKRDFIYIDDLVNIYHSLLNDLPTGKFEIYNTASGKALQIKELMMIIAKEMDKSTKLLDFNAKPMRYGEPMCSYACINKLEEKFHLSDQIDVIKGIQKYLIT